MKRFFLIILLVLLTLQALPASAAGVVYVAPIEGTIETGLASFISRVINRAERENASAVLLEINTFGGRVDAAVEIRDRIKAAKIPVIAFVADRAWSAGALITLGCPEVAMAPGSSIGAAEPRPADEKTISAVRAEFETTAQSRGRDSNLAAAMVDSDISIEGVVEEGELLTLPADKALELKIADTIKASRREVLQFFGYPMEVTEFTPTAAENIVRFLTEPTVSSLLLTLGFLGLLFEIFTAGWGIGGSVGLGALALFFGARLIAGLAGWEVVFLFLFGLLLLVLEVFVIPGFGIAGFGGIVAIFASLVLSFGSVQTAFYSIVGSLILTVLLTIWLSRYFKKTRAWDKLILQTSQQREKGYVALKDLQQYLGEEGVAVTTLRPAGTVRVGDLRIDAVTEGSFVPAGSSVRIVKVEGNRVFVRQIPED